MAFDFISEGLENRKKEGLLRKRAKLNASTGAMMEVDGQHYINFSGNDYLGMRQSSAVIQAYADGLSYYGVGSGASPLVTGYTQSHCDLEDYLADGLGRERVLLFNSGFAANQAICQALGHKSVSVLADKYIHASFIDGALAADSTFSRFRHNDLAHLSTQLDVAKGDTLVATEGVFSMDGDSAPLTEMAGICAGTGAWMMVDDAHGLGVFGKRGFGTVELAELSQQQVPVVMGTFGKAIGTAGAFVAGSEALIEYLVNFARHYVYSTAMPPAQAYATLHSLMALQTGEQQQKLHHNIAFFKQRMGNIDVRLMPSDSAIQPILVGDPNRAVALSERIRSLGIWVTAMRAPTVPKGTDRLRVTLSASHTEQDIIAMTDALAVALNEVVHVD